MAITERIEIDIANLKEVALVMPKMQPDITWKKKK
jgi:hypothetical protein